MKKMGKGSDISNRQFIRFVFMSIVFGSLKWDHRFIEGNVELLFFCVCGND